VGSRHGGRGFPSYGDGRGVIAQVVLVPLGVPAGRPTSAVGSGRAVAAGQGHGRTIAGDGRGIPARQGKGRLPRESTHGSRFPPASRHGMMTGLPEMERPRDHRQMVGGLNFWSVPTDNDRRKSSAPRKTPLSEGASSAAPLALDRSDRSMHIIAPTPPRGEGSFSVRSAPNRPHWADGRAS
jgi:hypothetical protein